MEEDEKLILREDQYFSSLSSLGIGFSFFFFKSKLKSAPKLTNK